MGTTESTSKSVREWLAVILSAGALLTALWIEVSHTDKENAVKIATLEAHQADEDKNVGGRLDKIENKVDRLVEWALGSK